MAPEYQAFVQKQIKLGYLKDKEEAINEAIRSMKEQTEWMKAEVQKGLESGASVPLDMAEILQTARKRHGFNH